MQTGDKDIWFPAKKYGWGWGLPCAWQGWVALAIWIAMLAGGAALFLRSERRPGLWFGWVVLMAVAFFILCLIKGEKPRWRWGKD
jgi:hypothetical protein